MNKMNVVINLMLLFAIINVTASQQQLVNTNNSSMVILHEQQDPDEGILRREFEHLKTFLANNMPVVNSISSWITNPIRRLWSRQQQQQQPLQKTGRSVIDDTVQAIYNRLIDYGFNSVGVSESCRELAICNTSNYILTQMPAFLESYGRERLMNFPTSVFGNHDYTNAWIVGLSSGEPSFCPSLFACDESSNHDQTIVTPATEKIPIHMNQQTAYYLTNSTSKQQPLMLLVEILDQKGNVTRF